MTAPASSRPGRIFGSDRLMRHNRYLLAATIFLSGLLFLPSCSPRDRIEGFVYYRLGSNPTTLDPALIVDVPGGSIAAKLFNGLVRLDHELNVVPDIAERWAISDSGKTYVFHLRPNVFFSNGREVTASDFRYSIERVLSPAGKSPNTWVLDRIAGARAFMEGRAAAVSGIETPGRYTLRIRLERPFSPFLNLLTMTAAYVVPKEEVESAGPDFSYRPVGSGPFVLNEWRHNSLLVLTRNERYFDRRAEASGIVYRIIPEDLTAITEFELGNIDLITIPAFEYDRYRRSARWGPLISSLRGLNTYYLGFNCSRPPFDDRQLRAAVAYALDREKILRTFYEGRGRLAEGPVPDLLRRWAPPGRLRYDPEEAVRIIRRQGMQGRTVNFYVSAEQEVVDIAEIIQSYLEKAGLRVRITRLEWSAYKEALNDGKADIFWIGWWADYPDAENFLFPLFHSSNHGASGNRSRYTNTVVDRLIETGQNALDDSSRDRSYGEAEGLIMEDLPWVPFWHRTDFTVRQPSLRSFSIPPIYSIDKGTEVAF